MATRSGTKLLRESLSLENIEKTRTVYSSRPKMLKCAESLSVKNLEKAAPWVAPHLDPGENC